MVPCFSRTISFTPELLVVSFGVHLLILVVVVIMEYLPFVLAVFG